MKKRLFAFSLAIVICAFSFTAVGVKNNNKSADVSVAQLQTYAENETVATTNRVDNFIGDKVDSVSNVGDLAGDLSQVAGEIGGYIDVTGIGGGSGGIGGIGDVIGGVGDALGGLIGGSSGTTSQGSAGVTYSVVDPYGGQIQMVPAATQNYATVPAGNYAGNATVNTPTVATTASLNVAETVDFAATANPYQKPTGELRGGDTGEGVKWMQWMFIYTRYGLKDDGITGVFDEDTIAVVKKLQKENNMTVDGIVNDAVIDKIELLYFQSTYTQPTLAVATTNTTTAVNVPVVVEEEDNSALVLIVVLIILIWIIAIAFVVLMFVKNKKKKSQAKKSAVQEEDDITATDNVEEQSKE